MSIEEDELYLAYVTQSSKRVLEWTWIDANCV